MNESMGSYEDASKEHEQSCVVVGSGLDLYSRVYSEQSMDPTEDIQGDESIVMIKHEPIGEDDMHNMHDEPFMENQL